MNLIHLFRFVLFEFQSNYLTLIHLQSQVLSFSEVSKIREEIRLPTADDILAHLANDVGFKNNKNIYIFE